VDDLVHATIRVFASPTSPVRSRCSAGCPKPTSRNGRAEWRSPSAGVSSWCEELPIGPGDESTPTGRGVPQGGSASITEIAGQTKPIFP